LPSTSIFRLPSSTIVPTPVGVSTPQGRTRRPDALDKRLKYQVDRDIAIICFCTFGLGRVAGRQRRDERGVEQFSDALAGQRGVIADDGEFGFSLPD
jgi:hypothetical protein